MAKRYFYKCVYPCDVAYFGPDQRRENWIESGRSTIPTYGMHSVRLRPQHGRRVNGRPFPADYIMTDQPVGKSYTEEVIKQVSRPASPYGGKRVNREKHNKIKLQLVDEGDIPADAEIHRRGLPVFIELTEDDMLAWQEHDRPLNKDKAGKNVQQIQGWAASMFEDSDWPVVLPEDTAKMWAAGRLALEPMAKGAV